MNDSMTPDPAAANCHDDPIAELFPQASRRGTPLRHWASGQLLVEHGEPKALEERIAERLPTPESLAELAPDLTVSVYGFLDTARERGSAAGTSTVQPLYTFPTRSIREALPLYHAGHTLICWRIRDLLPEALKRGTDILRSLGLPHAPMAARGLAEPWNKASMFVVSLVYTPANCTSGLGIHFDLFDSILVHLRGTKRWRVGRHPHLSFPIYNEESAAKLDYPPSLPRLATRSGLVGPLEEVEMRRGSAMLVPRGTYHTTQVGDEASLSVGYHFSLPTWSDLVLAALERRLNSDPHMRTTPFGAFDLDGPTDEAKLGMTSAVARVRDALADPVALLEEDLLDNLASHHQATFRYVPDAPAQLRLEDPPVIENYGDLGVNVEMPAETGVLCRWIHEGVPSWFDYDKAFAASAGHLSPLAVWNFLQEAVEAGVLQRRWGRRPQTT